MAVLSDETSMLKLAAGLQPVSCFRRETGAA